MNKIIIYFLLTVISNNTYALEKSCFTPKQDDFIFCEDLIIEELNKAQKEIKLSIYNFTNIKIKTSLLKAQQRGVDIIILYNRNQPNGSVIKDLQNLQKIKVYPHCGFAIHHHKFVIIDGKTMIHGSYNWTTNASLKNTEDGLLTDDRSTIILFEKKFNNLVLKYKACSIK